MAKIEEKIIKFINEEVKRLRYGKLFIEITVNNDKPTNIQIEQMRTRKSENINS